MFAAGRVAIRRCLQVARSRVMISRVRGPSVEESQPQVALRCSEEAATVEENRSQVDREGRPERSKSNLYHVCLTHASGHVGRATDNGVPRKRFHR